MSILHHLETRYSVRNFERGKIIPEETITKLLEATNLSASSLGLQPYKFIVVRGEEIQKELAKHSFHLIDVADASHLIVFASMTEMSDDYIHEYIERTERLRNLKRGELRDLEELTLKLIHEKTQEEFRVWAEKQAYVALGTLILAAAEAKVDMCPMEVINGDAYDRILGLKDKKLHASVVGVLGYRKHNDPVAKLTKSRRNLSDIVELVYE